MHRLAETSGIPFTQQWLLERLRRLFEGTEPQKLKNLPGVCLAVCNMGAAAFLADSDSSDHSIEELKRFDKRFQLLSNIPTIIFKEVINKEKIEEWDNQKEKNTKEYQEYLKKLSEFENYSKKFAKKSPEEQVILQEAFIFLNNIVQYQRPYEFSDWFDHDTPHYQDTGSVDRLVMSKKIERQGGYAQEKLPTGKFTKISLNLFFSILEDSIRQLQPPVRMSFILEANGHAILVNYLPHSDLSKNAGTWFVTESNQLNDLATLAHSKMKIQEGYSFKNAEKLGDLIINAFKKLLGQNQPLIMSTTVKVTGNNAEQLNTFITNLSKNEKFQNLFKITNENANTKMENERFTWLEYCVMHFNYKQVEQLLQCGAVLRPSTERETGKIEGIKVINSALLRRDTLMLSIILKHIAQHPESLPKGFKASNFSEVATEYLAFAMNTTKDLPCIKVLLAHGGDPFVLDHDLYNQTTPDIAELLKEYKNLKQFIAAVESVMDKYKKEKPDMRVNFLEQINEHIKFALEQLSQCLQSSIQNPSLSITSIGYDLNHSLVKTLAQIKVHHEQNSVMSFFTKSSLATYLEDVLKLFSYEAMIVHKESDLNLKNNI